jgi:hypothetical protein
MTIPGNLSPSSRAKSRDLGEGVLLRSFDKLRMTVLDHGVS